MRWVSWRRAGTAWQNIWGRTTSSIKDSVTISGSSGIKWARSLWRQSRHPVQRRRRTVHRQPFRKSRQRGCRQMRSCPGKRRMRLSAGICRGMDPPMRPCRRRRNLARRLQTRRLRNKRRQAVDFRLRSLSTARLPMKAVMKKVLMKKVLMETDLVKRVLTRRDLM